MQNTKSHMYLQSIVAIPLLAAMIPFSQLQVTESSFLREITETQVQMEETTTENTATEQAQKIDAYFAQHDLPLAGYGNIFVQYAHEYDIPWNLTAAIAMRESTGGKFMFRKNNPFGWGSRNFRSIEEAIRIVSWNLGGHNTKTRRFYEGKTIDGVLKSYNPPHVVASYSGEVQMIMADMSAMSLPADMHFAKR